jgi:hypothetical protein
VSSYRPGYASYMRVVKHAVDTAVTLLLEAYSLHRHDDMQKSHSFSISSVIKQS